MVWHFYTVIFDPDVYPMDTAWLTGVSVKEPEPHPNHVEPRDMRSRRKSPPAGDNIQMTTHAPSARCPPNFLR